MGGIKLGKDRTDLYRIPCPVVRSDATWEVRLCVSGVLDDVNFHRRGKVFIEKSIA